MTSCTLPVEDGMIIKTDTPLLRELRRFTLQLILSEHPYSCLICDKKQDCTSYMECIEKEPITFGCKYCSANGVCELQRLAEEFGIKEIPFSFRYRNIPVEDYDPFFERDYNLCILCGRCVRACAELRQAYIIDLHHRGPKTLVGTPFGMPHLDANCQFCGACVDACPTGAMRERYSKHLGEAERVVKTYCMLCSMGCKINAEIKDNLLLRTTPDSEPLCVRGRFGIAPLVNHPRRVTSPLKKRDGNLIEISWDEAFEIAGGILKEYQGKTGVLFSTDLTLEAINSLNTFTEIMGVEYLGSEIPSMTRYEEVSVIKRDIKTAFIVLNTDLIEDFSVFLLKAKISLKDSPVIIVIDPIKTKLAESADLWLRPEPGREWELLDLILSEERLQDFVWIKKKEIIEARRLIAHRQVCVFYNPNNIKNERKKEDLKYLPLIRSLNHSILNSTNLFRPDDILNNKDIECLYLIGTNIPKTKRYKKVIVQDSFLPDFDFDLFLPSATFMEVEGSFIDMFGKEKRLKKVIEPLGNSRADDWIIKTIVDKIDFEIVKKEGLREPNKEIGKEERVDPEYPFYLIVRENGFRYRNKSLSEILKGFKIVHEDSYLWINPEDAQRLKIEDYNRVKISGKDFETTIKVLITDRVPEGVVFGYYDRSKGLIESRPVRIECT